MEKQNLVLLHGWGMNPGVWGELIVAFESRFHIYAIELPDPGGFQSDAFDLDRYLDVILADAPATAHWLGWSLGGMLSALLAERNPERVERLVLVATNAMFCAHGGWPHAMPVKTFNAFRQKLAAKPLRTFKEFANLHFLGVEGHKRFAKQLFEKTAKQQPSVGELASGLELLALLDCRAAMRRLRLPVQLIHGGLDKITPVQSVNDIRNLNPDFVVEIVKDAGHAPFICHKDQVVKAIHRFFSSP